MKTILKIFKNDLIGIKKSILTIVLAVGLCILPALYAWFNIFANWDPYANTGNINIAVVPNSYSIIYINGVKNGFIL